MTVARPVNENCNLIFSHPRIEPSLVVDTGMDEIGWAYNLNTANFPTYGGEVVQILSVYIEDVFIKGTVRTYEDLEAIYTFFAKYMILATQGNNANVPIDSPNHYNQEPMTMMYSPRQWSFVIQPISAPGFTYSLETVAPEWQLQAHIVDTTPDVEALGDLVKQKVLEGEDSQNFALTGIISPASGDPTENPFAAPTTNVNGEFVPYTEAQTTEELNNYADYYNSLVPAYMKGDYKSIVSELGSTVAFGEFGVGAGTKKTTETK